MKGKTIGILVLALCLPGGIPVALGVWGYRAYARFKARRNTPAQQPRHVHDWHAWKWRRLGPREQEWTERCYACGETRTNSGAMN
jgi:hypothetical protein